MPKMETAPKSIPPAGLRIEMFPLTECLKRRWPTNPKGHDLDELEKSVNRFGFTEPPARDERSTRFVAGHGRLELLQRKRDAGEDPPTNVFWNEERTDYLVPVVCGNTFNSDAEAEAYIVASNRQTQLGGWLDNLPEFLVGIRDGTGSLEGTGYSMDDLEELLVAAAPAASGAPPSAPGDPGAGTYREQYGVIVLCADEAEQERVYNALHAEGYECKVVAT